MLFSCFIKKKEKIVSFIHLSAGVEKSFSKDQRKGEQSRELCKKTTVGDLGLFYQNSKLMTKLWSQLAYPPTLELKLRSAKAAQAHLHALGDKGSLTGLCSYCRLTLTVRFRSGHFHKWARAVDPRSSEIYNKLTYKEINLLQMCNLPIKLLNVSLQTCKVASVLPILLVIQG